MIDRSGNDYHREINNAVRYLNRYREAKTLDKASTMKDKLNGALSDFSAAKGRLVKAIISMLSILLKLTISVDEVYSRLAQQIGAARVEKDKIQEELDRLEDEEITRKEDIKKRRDELRSRQRGVLKCDYPVPPTKRVKRAREEPIVESLESEDEDYEDGDNIFQIEDDDIHPSDFDF